MATRKKARKKTTPKKDLILRRQEKAWDLRAKCLSYRAIAKQLKICPQQVLKDLDAARKRITDKSDGQAERERALELERLDRFEGKINTALDTVKGTQGLAQLAQSYKGISERRCKLLGLDAPTTTKTELSGPDGGPMLSAGEGWEERLKALGWTPPAGRGREVLPGLPAPSATQSIDASTTTIIEVKE